MKRSTTSWRLRSAELAVVALAWLALGCVTRGEHAGVVSERDALQERVRLLEASNESLSNERVKLISEVEDLGSEREQLAASVEELRATRDQLQENLELTSASRAALLQRSSAPPTARLV
jgi:cell division protein FtsB